MSRNLTISAGMPRAGSGWYYNLVHDLIVASGGQNAREIRKKYYLQRLLTEVNCNISTLKILRLSPVLIPALIGNKYAVKTHAGPTRFSDWLNQNGRIGTVYIYRDPRAAMLSAYEYGQKAIKQNRKNAFFQIKTLDDAAEFMKFYVKVWAAWSQAEETMLVRYEDLLADYNVEFDRLIGHLELQLDKNESKKICEQYKPEKGDPGRKGTHFSKGEADRFRGVFSQTQLNQFTAMFEPELSVMGYQP
ncbi:MAG: sulfotransferase domain-containing protein [Chloroflexota bacterium]|nr:MAG: sulfotransferase domain-containing protein [Chloroflexota bacterium]